MLDQDLFIEDIDSRITNLGEKMSEDYLFRCDASLLLDDMDDKDLIDFETDLSCISTIRRVNFPRDSNRCKEKYSKVTSLETIHEYPDEIIRESSEFDDSEANSLILDEIFLYDNSLESDIDSVLVNKVLDIFSRPGKSFYEPENKGKFN